MNPTDASVYSDTMSPLTWVLILTAIIVVVTALLVVFIALVHRSIERSADAPRSTPLLGVPVTGPPVESPAGAAAQVGAARPAGTSTAA